MSRSGMSEGSRESLNPNELSEGSVDDVISSDMPNSFEYETLFDGSSSGNLHQTREYEGFLTPVAGRPSARNVSFADVDQLENGFQNVVLTDDTVQDRTPLRGNPSSEQHRVQLPGGMMNTSVPCRFIGGRRRRPYTFRNRKKASPNDKSNLRRMRLANANRMDNPFDQDRQCCKRYSCFATVDPVHAFHWYRELMVMEREPYKATLISWFNTVRFQFEFDGEAVCWNFLRFGFGFSTALLNSVSKPDHARAAETIVAQPRDSRSRNLRNSIITFLRIISANEGDMMPHKNYTNLPFPCKKDVYEKYVEYFNIHDPLRFTRSPPKISYFYSVWKEYLPDVKTLKSTGFQKCAECVFYQEERTRNILNPAALRHINESRQQHYRSML